MEQNGIGEAAIRLVPDGGVWRVFRGAWVGVPTGNDRIYSRVTDDFCTFRNRTLHNDHGVFGHACNCSVVRLPDGSWPLGVTAYPDTNGLNKPAMFAGANGVDWDGAGPRQAAMTDLVEMRKDDGKLRMLCSDYQRWGSIWRSTQKEGCRFVRDGVSLAARRMVNDVKLFRTGGKKRYPMVLHANGDRLWYSLSTDGMTFEPEKQMATNNGPEDRHMVAIGWVTDGKALFGYLFGAGAVPSLDRHRIFARWLQKRVVFVPTGGHQPVGETRASGLDGARIPAPAARTRG